MGIEYDRPVVSTLSAQLKKYGIDKMPETVDAAFTWNHDRTNELFMFYERNYCSFEFVKDPIQQNCDMKSTKDSFLNYQNIKRMAKSGGNAAQSGTESLSESSVRNDVGVGNNEKISGLNKYLFTEKDKSEVTPIAKREGSEEENKPNAQSLEILKLVVIYI